MEKLKRPSPSNLLFPWAPSGALWQTKLVQVKVSGLDYTDVSRWNSILLQYELCLHCISMYFTLTISIYIYIYYISVCSFHFKIFHISIGSFCILFATAASPDPNGSAPFHVSQDHPEPCPCRQHQHWTGRPNHHRSIPKDAGEFSLGWPVFHYSSRFWFEQYHTLLDDLGMLCTLGKTTISRCKWNDSLL